MAQANVSNTQTTLGITTFSNNQLLFPLLIGSTGTLILGLQPVLLGALLSENRVTFDGLALIATVEMLAIGVGSVLLAMVFEASGMRIKSAVLLLAAAIGQVLTAYVDGLAALSILRAATGLAEGALISVAVEAVARTREPGRNGGWFIVVQTVAQSILAALLALVVIPEWKSPGGFIVVGVVTLAALGLLAWLRDDYGPLTKEETTAATESGKTRPALALGAIFALYLFIGAIWAFLEPLGGQSGISAPTVGLIVSLSLLAQVAGALSATALEPHIGYPSVIGGAALVAALIAVGFGVGSGTVIFWILSLATGFLWLFVVPWQISMTLAADRSRKTALLVPAAQLFGAAIGPAGAAALIAPPDFHPAAWFASAAALLSFALLVVLVVASKNKVGVRNAV